MREPLTFLNPLDIRIVKQINIVSQNRHGNNIVIGFIMYKRKLTETYNFPGVYPHNPEFPEDDIDRMILESIQAIYNDSYVNNIFMSTNLDEDYVDNLINRPSEDSGLVYRPTIPIDKYESLSGQQIMIWQKKVKVFINGSSEQIKGLRFVGGCNLNTHLELFDELDEIEFL